MTTAETPVLRLAPGRLRTWGIGLFLICLVPIVGAPMFGFHDWPAFWAAGGTVGTPDLVIPERLFAWQQAHGVNLGYFTYPPAVAFLLAPFSWVPLGLAFAIQALLMLACAVLAGRLGARLYDVPAWVGVIAVLAWAPVTAAVVIGQNTPLALLLAIIAIGGLVADRAFVTGGAIAALLYKPTIGLPLAGLLLLRGRWTALAVVAAGALAWYLVGIPASGGDPGWPIPWLAGIREWLPIDLVKNGDKAISVTSLVSRLGLPEWVPYLAGGLVVLIAIPPLRRSPVLESATMACLVGVAVSPHAWSYEAALVVPALLLALSDREGRVFGVTEPWRTRLLVGAYLAAPLWLVSSLSVVSVVGVIVLVMTGLWLWRSWTRPQAVAAAPRVGPSESP